MSSPYVTFADLRDRAGELGYAAESLSDLVKALDRAVRLYENLPLERIPIDIAAFDRRWAERADTLTLGFKSPKAFAKWRSCIRGAIKRAVGLKPVEGAREPDAWAALQAYVEANSGVAKLFPHNRHLTLPVMIERARLTGRASPADLDDAWVREQALLVHNGRRKAFVKAVTFLTDLAADRSAHPAIAGLLPRCPLAPVPGLRGAAFGGAQLPDSFAADLDAFLQWYRTCGLDPNFIAHAPQAGKEPTSLSAYRSAISWLVREVVAGEILAPEEITGLAVVCTAEVIRRAAHAFSQRRADEASALKSQASSLHCYVSKSVFVARHWIKVTKDDEAKLTELLRQPAVRTPGVGRIAADRETFIRKLARDAGLQAAILTLPDTLMRAADTLLAQWADLGRGGRMLALRLALAATQAAILLRSMPVRATNLRELTFRGEGRTLILPRWKGDDMLIAIPAADVKNHRHLEAAIPRLAEPIVRRWLEVYRPLLIKEHPFCTGMVDSDYLFPGTRWDAPMDASVFAGAFAIGVAHAGLALTLHECRHAVATLALKADRSRIKIVADWLGDDVATVEKYYSFLDTSAAAEISQAHMAVLVRDARKRRRA